jgi:hypothetical protein
MNSEEIALLVREETSIRLFGATITLEVKVNSRGAAFRHKFQVFQNISMKIFGHLNVTALLVRLPICGILLSILVVGNLHASEWQEVSRNSKLKIYIRHRTDSPIEEIRGIGEFDAPIAVLKAILADVTKYSEFMPYTKESRQLPQSAQLLYMVLTPPLVGTLDYTIRVHEESSKGIDGATTYRSRWELANLDGPAPQPGVTRVTINEGSWLLEPIGNQTRATYTLYTDGGGIPALIMNFANKQSVTRLFEALHARMHDGSSS